MASPKQMNDIIKIAKIVGPVALLGGLASKCFWNVGVGEMGLKFNRLTGLSDKTYIEGFHLMIPFLEVPIKLRTKVKNYDIHVSTPNRDLQLVNLNARVVYRPDKTKLHKIYATLGNQYDKKVLNTVVAEIIRGIVAQFNAQQLISARDQVSNQIKFSLKQRAALYGVIIDEFAISNLSFSPQYQNAVERKQVAYQQALEAKFRVQQAKQKKKSIIIQAMADAAGIEQIGKEVASNPAYLDLERINLSQDMASVLAKARNRIILDSDVLLLNSLATKDDSDK